MEQLDRLAEGIKRADAAGDTAGVAVLGAEYRRLQSAAASADKEAPKTTLAGVAQSANRGLVRSLGPVAAGATMGAAFGAPFAGIGAFPGAALGATAAGIEELGGNLYNMAGSSMGLPHYTTLGESMDRGMTALGARQPQTPTERMVEAGAAGLGGAAGMTRTAGAMAPLVKTPLAKNLTQSMTAMPTRQMVGGTTGALASQGTAEAGGGPMAQLAAGAVGGGIPFLRGGKPQIMSGETPLTPAQQKAAFFAKALQEKGNQANMAAAPDYMTSAEAMGGNAPMHLRGLSKQSGLTASALEPMLYTRAMGREGRMFETTAKETGFDPNAAKGDFQEMSDQSKAAVAPVFKEAYAATSKSPFKDRTENANTALGRLVSEAEQTVKDAENSHTQLLAKSSQRSDVYGPTPQDIMDSETAIENAQNNLDALTTRKGEVLDSLREVQADIASGKQGAIWSPAIQRFVSLPVVKQGIKKGLAIEQMAAARENRPMRSNDFSVKMDAKGNPILDENGDVQVIGVPTTRLLHVAKMGLDDMLPKNPNTGAPIYSKNGYNYEIQRLSSAISNEVRRLNPKFDEAMDMSGDYLSAQEGFQRGADAVFNNRVTTDDFAKMYQKGSSFYKEAIKGGIANKIFNAAQAANIKGGYVPAKSLLGKSTFEKLSISMGKDNAQNFIDSIDNELKAAAFEKVAAPAAGSATTPLSEVIKQQIGEPGPVYKFAEDLVGPGSFTGKVVKSAVGQGMKLSRNLARGGLNEQARNELGDLLMKSPQAYQTYMDKLNIKLPLSSKTPYGSALVNALSQYQRPNYEDFK